jgi:hypothetical protein
MGRNIVTTGMMIPAQEVPTRITPAWCSKTRAMWEAHSSAVVPSKSRGSKSTATLRTPDPESRSRTRSQPLGPWVHPWTNATVGWSLATRRGYWSFSSASGSWESPSGLATMAWRTNPIAQLMPRVASVGSMCQSTTMRS